MCFVKTTLKKEALDGQTEGERKKQALLERVEPTSPLKRMPANFYGHNSNLPSARSDSPVASDGVTPELCRLPAQPAGLREVGTTWEHCRKLLPVLPEIQLPVSLRLPFFAHKRSLCSLRAGGLRKATVKTSEDRRRS